MIMETLNARTTKCFSASFSFYHSLSIIPHIYTSATVVLRILFAYILMIISEYFSDDLIVSKILVCLTMDHVIKRKWWKLIGFGTWPTGI